MTREVVDITLDRTAVLILLIQKSNLRQLSIAKIAGGFAPNQPDLIALIKIVEIDFDWCPRWHVEGVRVGRQIRHRHFHHKPAAAREVVVASLEYRDLIGEFEHVTERGTRNDDQVEFRISRPAPHIIVDER